MTEIEQLQMQLKSLALHHMAEIFEEQAHKATQAKMAYTSYLARLVEEQLLVKTDRSVQAKIRKAKFPALKTLETFDFSFQPSLDERKVKELAQLGFISKQENIVLLGPPGVGKTHLAIGLGIRACQNKIRTLFSTVTSLMDQLYTTLIDNSTVEMIEGYCRFPLMIIDELGYMSLDIQRANLFFQLISKRYEKASTIITTNLPFEQWGTIFGQDEVIGSAILDRFLHYCHIMPIQGNSYRVKDKLKPKQKAKLS
jgi:DNA replication protein DnaC